MDVHLLDIVCFQNFANLHCCIETTHNHLDQFSAKSVCPAWVQIVIYCSVRYPLLHLILAIETNDESSAIGNL